MFDERGLAHRHLLVISGEEDWAKTTAEHLLSQQSAEHILRYAARDGRHKAGDINSILGKEYSCVVFDMFAGFDPDALAACTGTIMAGGYLILLTPDLSLWKTFQDSFSVRYLNWPHQAEDIQQRFLRRFIRILRESDFPEFITPSTAKPAPLKAFTPPILKASQHQQQVIRALLDTYQNDAGWPVVLQADRGRGKSSALAIFVNKLIEKHALKIAIYAPSKLSLGSFYQQGNDLEEYVTFKTLEELLESTQDLDLLLIDEAATIAMHALKELLTRYPRTVLSTTLHGYEGSGHGFSIRLRHHLETHYPAWSELSMQQPIRYAENDPLEGFIHRALLLEADLSTFSGNEVDAEACQFMEVSQDQLMQDEGLLQNIVGLLVIAHYQTRPSDLRHLLDGLQVKIYAVKYQENLIAAAVTVKEGGFDKPLADEIHWGKRRPRGNLIPQSLINHIGVPEIAEFTTERIMRIVVHPHVQNQGIGSALLTYMQTTSIDSDYWSTSYALTGKRIVKFWRDAGFQTVRVGMQCDKSSGNRSVMMVKFPLSSANNILQLCQLRFSKQLTALQVSEFADISAELFSFLGVQPTKADFDSYDQRDLDSYCEGHRPLEMCLYAIQTWLKGCADNGVDVKSLLNQQDYRFLHTKIIENRSWREVCSIISIQGKKQAKERLREIIYFLTQCQQMELYREP